MNKFLKVIKVLINTLMTLILVFGIIFIILYVIGIEPFVVESGSMEPTIQRGSLSFINKHIEYNEIKEYDVIAFSLPSEKKVTHRVVKITDSGMETKGDHNATSDGLIVTKENYVGKNVFSIPKVGYAVMLIQTTKGKIIMGTFIIVLLLLGFLFGDNKKGNRVKEW